jgi:hypothetical protein
MLADLPYELAERGLLIICTAAAEERREMISFASGTGK